MIDESFQFRTTTRVAVVVTDPLVLETTPSNPLERQARAMTSVTTSYAPCTNLRLGRDGWDAYAYL